MKIKSLLILLIFAISIFLTGCVPEEEPWFTIHYKLDLLEQAYRGNIETEEIVSSLFADTYKEKVILPNGKALYGEASGWALYSKWRPSRLIDPNFKMSILGEWQINDYQIMVLIETNVQGRENRTIYFERYGDDWFITGMVLHATEQYKL